jgi:putative PIG3 family NAD(P)H quinone oxidoreductase
VENMRAVVLQDYGDPEVLQIKEIRTPDLDSEEVLVRIAYSALNRADILQRRGLYPAPDIAGNGPEVPGLEFSGVIEEVGARVPNRKRGDRVCGLLGGGGYAEYATVHHLMLLDIPKNLSLAEAAAIPEVFLTAFDALEDKGALAAGETVLIHAGGSGVGTAATQIARILGASRIFATLGSDEKADAAIALGVDRAINYNREDFAAIVLEETSNEGVNVILDVVGKTYMEGNLRAAAVEGRIVCIAYLGGGLGEIHLPTLLQKRLRLQGTLLRTRPTDQKMELSTRFSRRMMPFFAQGKLRPVIDCVFPLEDVADAHEYMEHNRNFGKILLAVNPEL